MSMQPFIESDIATLLAVGSSVAIGTRGLVHVWGRNDMATTQKMGISWVVRDPDNIIRESYSTWELAPNTPAGKEHEFIGGRFDINKVGDWRIAIGLFMNPDNPVQVDSYSGLLCRVTEDYAGTISRMELEYDSARGAIPVT